MPPPPIDAAFPDATPQPPVTNGESANLVLGQPDFMSSTANYGGQGQKSLNNPWSVAVYSGSLWVADYLNGRAMEWAPIPTSNVNATEMVGQAGYTTSSLQSTQSLLSAALCVFSDGSHLFVCDNTNRIVIWSPIPSQVGHAATSLLGQTLWNGSTGGKGAGNLDGAHGAWSDGTHVVVADGANNRVLIWNSFPTASGTAANVVLGWNTFGYGRGDAEPATPTASTLNSPQGVFFDGTWLWVADTNNNRVLGWNGMPTTSGQAANIVLGQGSFGGASANQGGAVTEKTLNSPYSVWVTGNSLFVADTFNHRVVVYTPVPTASNTAASAVLGQGDLRHNTASSTPSATVFGYPYGVAATATEVFVADTGNNRVLGFPLH
jgi:hypothetical protein